MSNATFSHAQALAALAAHPAAGTPDIACVLKVDHVTYGYSEAVHALALTMLGDTLPSMLTLPQKQVKRFAQLLNALSHKTPSACDYTHARLLLSLREAGTYALNRDALHALTANTISPDANMRGISRSRINRIFKLHHGSSTVETKLSNSAGKNGYMSRAGMLYTNGAKNAAITINYESPLIIAFFNMIDGASDGQLQALADKGEKKGK